MVIILSLIRNEKRFLSSLIISYQMDSYKSLMIFSLVISETNDNLLIESSVSDSFNKKR